jgi:hypothetical protein
MFDENFQKEMQDSLLEAQALLKKTRNDIPSSTSIEDKVKDEFNEFDMSYLIEECCPKYERTTSEFSEEKLIEDITNELIKEYPLEIQEKIKEQLKSTSF